MKKRGVQPGKIFEVREIESDFSFLHNYLTKDLVMREDMYLFQKQGRDFKIVHKEWERIPEQLVNMLHEK